MEARITCEQSHAWIVISLGIGLKSRKIKHGIFDTTGTVTRLPSISMNESEQNRRSLTVRFFKIRGKCNSDSNDIKE
jgi:hypothetical protein